MTCKISAIDPVYDRVVVEVPLAFYSKEVRNLFSTNEEGKEKLLL